MKYLLCACVCDQTLLFIRFLITNSEMVWIGETIFSRSPDRVALQTDQLNRLKQTPYRRSIIGIHAL